MTTMRTYTTWILALFIGMVFGIVGVEQADSATLANSSKEVSYEYKVSFRSLKKVNDPKVDEEELAKFHAWHLFGLFHAPQFAEQNGFPLELTEGFAGTELPEVKDVRVFNKKGDDYLWVEYVGVAKMLLLNQVYKNILGDKKEIQYQFPLLVNFPKIYSDDMKKYRDPTFVKCTDAHYKEPKDFSYFYNPFRCPELAEEPLAQKITFNLKLVEENVEKKGTLVPLSQIRGENENGKLTTLYFINGFDVSPKSGATPGQIHRDSGWKLYKSLEKRLTKEMGFEKMESLGDLREVLGEDFGYLNLLTEVNLNHDTQRRYFSTFVKKTRSRTWVVRSALFTTDNDTGSRPLLSFPKFWKEAWENGDFIYFGGHSGDGASLSLENMLKNLTSADLEDIQYPKNKMQIAMIDACSSYAHYQHQYVVNKSENLHLITYGLVSLYHAAEATVQNLLELTMDQEEQITWVDALKDMEKAQLRPHVEFLYDGSSERKINETYKKYLSREEYPSLLLNVWVP